MLMRGESERYRNRINRTILECKEYSCSQTTVGSGTNVVNIAST